MKPVLILRSAVVTFFLFPLWTVFLCGLAVLCQGILKSRRAANWVIVLWGRSICWMYGVRLDVEGAENVPGTGAMFLFNHTSFFDIFSIYATFPFVRFGAKLELFSIPVFGYTMKSLGTLPIARSNREAAIRVLEEALDRARHGEQFALSPEGGRNTEEKLLPFKAGPFLFAIQAQVPLVPLVIRGALDVWPKGAVLPATRSWRSVIRLRLLPPIPTTGRTIAERGALQSEVRARMEEALQT